MASHNVAPLLFLYIYYTTDKYGIKALFYWDYTAKLGEKKGEENVYEVYDYQFFLYLRRACEHA